MSTEHIDFAQQLENVHARSTLKAILLRFTRHLGFERCIYGGRFPLPDGNASHVSVGDFPSEWQSLYEERQFLRIDPIALHAFKSPLPVVWDEVPRKTTEEQEFFRLAANYGLVHGVASPAMGRKGDIGMFSVSREQPVPGDRDVRSALKQEMMLFTSLLHIAVSRLEAVETGPTAERLTKREKECLVLAARNLTSHQIGESLGITERTVLYHIDQSSKKYGVTGRHRVIDAAIAAGELELDERTLLAYRALPKTRVLV